ncbi:MAG: hypothetical protein WB587_02285, partial [Nitrososphaeraceae archaeon]
MKSEFAISAPCLNKAALVMVTLSCLGLASLPQAFAQDLQYVSHQDEIILCDCISIEVTTHKARAIRSSIIIHRRLQSCNYFSSYAFF